MKLLFVLAMTLVGFVHAQDQFSDAGKNALLKEAANLYSQGKYNATAEELIAVEAKLPSTSSKSLRGLISYWKAICYNKSQDFPAAIANFDKSLQYDYRPEDIHYEYGQALFAAEKLQEARLQFRESLKRKFKRAVSLYYIAYVSKELGDKKKAVTFYQAIDKLNDEEAMEVKQAAQMQIGDIYLEQVEKHPDAIKAVETYVIPQYKYAYEVDQKSALAPQIQHKIRSLQEKYDLVMFRLRNGRPTRSSLFCPSGSRSRDG